jgi:hypothetical protein
LASAQVPFGHAVRQQRNSISSSTTQRLATSAPRHWPNSRTTQHGWRRGPVAAASQIGFVKMAGTAPLRGTGACDAGVGAEKSAGAFEGSEIRCDLSRKVQKKHLRQFMIYLCRKIG